MRIVTHKIAIVVAFISIVLACVPAYAVTLLSGPDTDGCYEIRVEGEDIVSDVSIVSDFYVSRDGGKNWKVMLKDSDKVVNWLKANGTKAINAINAPAGHYNAVKIRSHRIIKADLEYREGRPSRVEEFDFGADFDFVIEYIDMTLNKDSSVALRFDNPLVYLDLRVKWDTVLNAYADPVIIDQVFKKDITGLAFFVEQMALEEK